MELFGFQITRAQSKAEENEEKNRKSFVPPTNDDGALVTHEGGIYGTHIDLDGTVRTEAELITRYRTISQDPTIDMAVTDICNEAIVDTDDDEIVKINLDDVEIDPKIKQLIQYEFETILNLLNFNEDAYELFKRWYVDGRIYYHTIIDEKNPRDGIKELRYIDPRHIKKVRVMEKKKLDNQHSIQMQYLKAEYYVYSPAGFLKKSGSLGVNDNIEGLKIAKDSILYSTSGYLDPQGKMILSYLHKAIRPLNQLRAMQDSLVIYRISRAPERRIFYVDVGGLPKAKAEQYLRDLMSRFKNRTVYDSATGEIRDDRKFMTYLEDFWLPRRDGGRGTEITTLPGGQNLGDIEDVVFFQNELYKSLNVPITRLQPEAQFNLGRATEISRDEVKFAKFIVRLRAKFSKLFLKLLERQLVLTGVCTLKDFDVWKRKIKFDYSVDNYFEELKNMEIIRDRVGLAKDMEDFLGRYYSNYYIRRDILKQSDDEIAQIDAEVEQESQSTAPIAVSPEENGPPPGEEATPQSAPPEQPQPNRRKNKSPVDSPQRDSSPKAEHRKMVSPGISLTEMDIQDIPVDEITPEQSALVEKMTKFANDLDEDDE